MEDLCRICGTHSITLVGIFDERQRRQFKGEVEPNLADMVKKCAEVLIDPGDPLPQKMCRNCVQDAQIAYRFKRRCEQSYQKFYLAIANQPEIKEEPEPLGDHFIIEEQYPDAVSLKELTRAKKDLPKEDQSQNKPKPRLTKKSQGSESFKCELCAKEFQHQRNLLEHMK